ncbi:hypothetical protein Acsp04_13140 [Actinomadura sp. NBRC 104425]|nr:hypothetical protein Acsp04_13140 [Actinomadura sp. NBRC 104425]
MSLTPGTAPGLAFYLHTLWWMAPAGREGSPGAADVPEGRRHPSWRGAVAGPPLARPDECRGGVVRRRRGGHQGVCGTGQAPVGRQPCPWEPLEMGSQARTSVPPSGPGPTVQ